LRSAELRCKQELMPRLGIEEVLDDDENGL